MKRSILSLLILLSVICKAQVYVGAGAGMLVNKANLAMELQMGYQFKTWLLQSGFHAPLDNSSPVFYQFKAGKSLPVSDLSSFNLTGGKSWHYVSSDRKWENKWVWVASAEYNRRLYNGMWFVEYTWFDSGYHFITFGLKYLFLKN